MKTPAEVARSWLKKAEAENDDFDRFVSAWFAFNAVYGQRFDGDERRAIGDLLHDPEFRLPDPAIRTMLANPGVRYFVDRDSPIRSTRGDGRDTRGEQIRLRNKGWPPIQRLHALLRILYQVRCNLFHGDKMYTSELDQEVVRHAANALIPVVRSYVAQA